MFFVFHVLILTVLQVSKINSFVAVAEVQPDGESQSGNDNSVVTRNILNNIEC